MSSYTPESYQFVLTEKQGAIGYLTLNRPKKLNALHLAFVVEIVNAMRELDADPDVRVIVVKANGRSFCVGGDLSPEAAREFAFLDSAVAYRKLAQTWARAGKAIRDLSKPTVAQVHGHCLAGATDIFFNCDFLIAAEDAQFGCPDVKGMETPFAHMWTYLVGPQWAKFFLLTGDNIDGVTAERIGLVMNAVPADTLADEVNRLATRIAQIPVDLLSPNKSLVNRVLDNMGFAASQEAAMDASTFTHLAPEVREFHQISAEKGFKAAFAWRDRTDRKT